MFWILLALVLAAGEMMTLSFFLAPFAVGALFGAGADLAGAGAVVAVLVFLVASALMFGFVRPLARRHLRTPAQLRTGTAALVGKPATAIALVSCSGGSVKLDGEVWSARTYDADEVIQPGSRVHVVEIQGATALVSETL